MMADATRGSNVSPPDLALAVDPCRFDVEARVECHVLAHPRAEARTEHPSGRVMGRPWVTSASNDLAASGSSFDSASSHAVQAAWYMLQ